MWVSMRYKDTYISLDKETWIDQVGNTFPALVGSLVVGGKLIVTMEIG